MFKRVLIANRGAIAVRIIRTLNVMGIESVAVYAECDRDSLHVRYASQAFSLGEGGATTTYLDMDKILAVARESGAEAIHPGYGFLSENAEFVRRCEAEGICFIGPRAEQIEAFGLKHRARELAEAAQVPLAPGSDLLQDLASAQSAAEQIGFPVMLKSTAGGGGIGMQLCHSPEELSKAFATVQRLGASHFANDGVFLEKFIARARHIEVQVFGDGQGQAVAVGERDCSSQRRNQKVVEECPAPRLSEDLRQALHRTAEALVASVNYRNAGTVEFIYDDDSDTFYFLEVNTRLQVEHGVTEMVYDIDLVEWMLKQAAGELAPLSSFALVARGHAIQVRLYAEDPFRDFQPCAGLLSSVSFPSGDGLRIDHWIESGIEVPALFDPMLAKVIAHGGTREQSLQRLCAAIDQTELYGIVSNRDYLSQLLRDPVLEDARVTTAYLNHFEYQPFRMDVLQAGTQTMVQDYPGRAGYWDVGVPPSGPFDNVSFRLANRLLGNTEAAAALEITMQGPTLAFSSSTRIAVTGANLAVTVDDAPVSMYQTIDIRPGQVLKLGRIVGNGARAYLAIQGGIQCPEYLGSRSTFTLGQFGGHGGRALRVGDVLNLLPVSENLVDSPLSLTEELIPEIGQHWSLRVIYGPHGAPDFFTERDIETFFEHEWEVHYNSSRTGIRLIGPKPEWARADGGEAGLHPSNIHDNAYAFGTVDFTGDMPVILGPDGPSLGGFVCPATVIQADLWKLGQLRAGDKIRFQPVSLSSARSLHEAQLASLETLRAKPLPEPGTELGSPLLDRLDAKDVGVDVVYRVAGDQFLLIEYGEQVLDIALRFRVHALMQWLQAHPLEGMLELTPGIRSLQVHYNSLALSLNALLEHLKQAESTLADQLDRMTVPSRIVYLPLSWDDEACQQAIDKYQQSVRANAPWCPSNLEFIRRINGLDSIAEVKDIVFSASYLVMGLGDVYLGAPVATPVDPSHRLVTTKYNPARTWTAENSVGIGGSYLCVYGMEGPGGYQFVGRTLQMWNRFRETEAFTRPWLLRFFDQIRFYEVSHDELQQIRRDVPHGRYGIRIEESEFSLADYQASLTRNATKIEAFKQHREAAYEAELAAWHANGQFNFEAPEISSDSAELSWPEDSLVVDSPVSGSVWRVEVESGDRVEAGQTLMILESMKMEIPVQAMAAGEVLQVLPKAGQGIVAGQALVVMNESTEADSHGKKKESCDVNE